MSSQRLVSFTHPSTRSINGPAQCDGSTPDGRPSTNYEVADSPRTEAAPLLDGVMDRQPDKTLLHRLVPASHRATRTPAGPSARIKERSQRKTRKSTAAMGGAFIVGCGDISSAFALIDAPAIVRPGGRKKTESLSSPAAEKKKGESKLTRANLVARVLEFCEGEYKSNVKALLEGTEEFSFRPEPWGPGFRIITRISSMSNHKLLTFRFQEFVRPLFHAMFTLCPSAVVLAVAPRQRCLVP
jgi:hypothetical protein